MSKFYYFRQNNSGGSFEHEPKDGISIGLFIEADNADHANIRAERIGLYFDGCSTGMDCSCCGDRWSPVGQWSKKDCGTETPEVYGEKWRATEEGEEPTLDWGIPFYIHFIGGEFRTAKKAATQGPTP